LSFVYTVPGPLKSGDDRAYIIRRGRVRAEFPAPRTATEKRAFDARVAELLAPAERGGNTVPGHEVDEVLLVAAWFRKFPKELKRAKEFGAATRAALSA
jgi:excinuclease ABC subunit C